MVLLLVLQKMVTLVVLEVLAVVLTSVILVVEPISVCIVSLEAVVAPLHQLLDHVGSECQMVVVGGWHGAKSFLLPERAPRMLVAAAVRARPCSWPVVPV